MAELVDLVNRAQDGDRDAFERLVARFQNMAVGYAYSVLGDLHLAEDAAQEAFVGVYLDLPKLRTPEAFPGWLRRNVFKYCDRLTRGKRLRTVPLEAAYAAASEDAAPDEEAESSEVKGRIHAALRMLPGDQRVVTTLFYIGGQSQAEVGAFLGITVSTVKNRLRAARSSLRERMVGMVEENLHRQRPSRDDEFGRKVMDDIARLSQRDIQILFHQTDLALRDLAVAVKVGGPELGKRVFANISAHLGLMVREEMEYVGPLSEGDADDVQARLQATLHRLQEASRIGGPLPEEELGEDNAFEPDDDFVSAQRAIQESLESRSLPELDFDEITESVGHLARCARKLGILYAFGDLVTVGSDSLLRLCLQMIVDGFVPTRVADVCDTQTRTLMRNHRTQCRMIAEAVAGIRQADHPRVVEQWIRTQYAPGREPLGEYVKASVEEVLAVLGGAVLCQTALDDVAEALVGLSILSRTESADAFANLAGSIQEPLLRHGLELVLGGAEVAEIQDELERRTETLLGRYETRYRMLIEGMLAIQNAEHPQAIERKVRSFYE